MTRSPPETRSPFALGLGLRDPLRQFAYFAQRDRWFRAIVTDGWLLHGV
jgi:hypothetical protein